MAAAVGGRFNVIHFHIQNEYYKTCVCRQPIANKCILKLVIQPNRETEANTFQLCSCLFDNSGVQSTHLFHVIKWIKTQMKANDNNTGRKASGQTECVACGNFAKGRNGMSHIFNEWPQKRFSQSLRVMKMTVIMVCDIWTRHAWLWVWLKIANVMAFKCAGGCNRQEPVHPLEMGSNRRAHFNSYNNNRNDYAINWITSELLE